MTGDSQVDLLASWYKNEIFGAEKRSGSPNFIRTSVYDKHSGSMEITTHLDEISRCKTASGTNWSNRWTYRVFIIKTRRDQMSEPKLTEKEVEPVGREGRCFQRPCPQPLFCHSPLPPHPPHRRPLPPPPPRLSSPLPARKSA